MFTEHAEQTHRLSRFTFIEATCESIEFTIRPMQLASQLIGYLPAIRLTNCGGARATHRHVIIAPIKITKERM